MTWDEISSSFQTKSSVQTGIMFSSFFFKHSNYKEEAPLVLHFYYGEEERGESCFWSRDTLILHFPLNFMHNQHITFPLSWRDDYQDFRISAIFSSASRKCCACWLSNSCCHWFSLLKILNIYIYLVFQVAFLSCQFDTHSLCLHQLHKT